MIIGLAHPVLTCIFTVGIFVLENFGDEKLLFEEIAHRGKFIIANTLQRLTFPQEKIN